LNPKVARVDRSTSTVSATADVFPKLVEAVAVPYSGAIREFQKIFIFVVPLLALAYVGFLWYMPFAVLVRAMERLFDCDLVFWLPARQERPMTRVWLVGRGMLETFPIKASDNSGVDGDKRVYRY